MAILSGLSDVLSGDTFAAMLRNAFGIGLKDSFRNFHAIQIMKWLVAAFHYTPERLPSTQDDI